MTRPTKPPFDLTYRPASYWDVPERIHANVKGEHRRRLIQQAAQDGTLDDLPPEAFSDGVPGEVWQAAGRIRPSYMGGETLPDYEEDEVEIARISFPQSVLGDVYSLRARREAGLIHYRLVDDNGGEDDGLDPGTSTEPLSFSELIDLIASAGGDDCNPGIVFGKWWGDYTEFGTPPEECTDQIELSSPYYPELSDWYDREAADWCRERYAEQAEAEALDESPPRDDTEGVAPHLRRLAFSAAERARELGYEEEPLFTPEGADAYVKHGHLEKAAVAFSSFCGQPVAPAKYAHLGPLDPDRFDEDYTPASYGEPWEHRAQLFTELPGVLHAIAEASLPDDRLPPLRAGEVEIARVRLGEVPDGLLSLRAQQDDGGLRYRLVDDNSSHIRLPFERSDKPLPLRDLVRLLDEAWDAGPEGTDTPETSSCGIGAVWSNWAEQIQGGATPVEARRYTVVSSVYYPMLARWYDAAERVWLRSYEEGAGQ